MMWHENNPDRPVSRLDQEEKQAPSGNRQQGAKVEEPNYEEYDYLANSASTSDMTGLIYAAVQNEEQAESYEDVYEYLPPEASAEQLK